MRFINEILRSYFFGTFPARLNWAITDMCNSRCIFCEAPAGFKGKADCSTERALSVCNEIAHLGVKEVHIVGGEAFLRRDIWKILMALRQHKIRVIITTNGLAFHSFGEREKEVISECVDKLRFSFDSTVPDEYDRIRGVEGAHDKISKAIEEWARKKKPTVIVTSVIMQGNIEEVPKIVRRCSEKNVRFVDFQPVSPVSIFNNIGALESKKELIPRRDDMEKLKEKIDEGIEVSKKARIPTTLPFFKYYAEPYFLSLSQEKNDFFFFDIVRPFICIKINMSSFLDYDGTLKLCPLLGEGADVSNGSLADGWKKLKDLRETIEKRHFPPACRFCFCNIAENIIFSALRHPVKNRRIVKKIFPDLLEIVRL